MAKGDELQDLLIQFAARTIRLCRSLPKTTEGRHVAGQLVRSGTAPAPHHAEARSAESTADFIHKIKIAVKELNETEVWLKIIIASDLKPENLVASLLDECNQLQRILGASISTARKSANRLP